ncbi:hypothetical protein Scep_002454 [Stephania cephalantha]|uniref:NAC domain-containing protein n=1 Tax=Stephania cephalantha TaxID=152367 RepID=A0AAP0LA14_9MAGN
MADNNVNLPPGFHFSPTDEELIVHFLYRKAMLLPCNPDIIPDLDLHSYNPWELNEKALAGGDKWYFFSRATENRFSTNGYWMPMDDVEEEEVVTNGSKRVGTKKYLVFYIGEPPVGIKSTWIMHEYHLSDCCTSSRRSSRRRGKRRDQDVPKLVLCRVFEKNDGSQGGGGDDDGDETDLSCLDEVFLSLEDLDEVSDGIR